MEIMTPTNPRWDEFTEKLGGEDGCNFREKDGKTIWTCNGEKDRPFARKILTEMGDIDIDATMEFFNKHGGYCDCEILFNVE